MQSPELKGASRFSLVGRWWKSAELGAVLLVALAALWFQVSLPHRLVTENDYLAAAKFLAERAKPGDVILLHPWWTERARLFAPQSLPVVGYFGSDRDPLHSFSRVWLLAQPRLPKSNFDGFLRSFGRDRSALEQPSRFGNLELTPYRNDLFRPKLFEAASSFALAHVYLENPDGQRLNCPFDGKAHRCPGPGQLYVAPEWHELHYRPERCLWFHPPGGTTRLVAEFPEVPLGHWLTLEGGLTWDRATFHHASITPVSVGVEEIIQGRAPLRLTFPPGADQPQAAEWKVPAGSPAATSLKLWAQSSNSELRDLCVNLLSEGAAAVEMR